MGCLAQNPTQRLSVSVLVAMIILGCGGGSCNISLPGCPDRCGDVLIPFPFGTIPNCYLEEAFLITCNTSTGTPIPFLRKSKTLVVTNISVYDGELSVLHYIARDCYDGEGLQGPDDHNKARILLPDDLTISATKNKFRAIGCDTVAHMKGYRGEQWFETSCTSSCDNVLMINGSCSGIGCCESSIPQGMHNMTLWVSSLDNHTHVWEFNPCSYAFVVEDDKFQFSISSFGELNNTDQKLPLVLEWTIGNENCEQAREKNSSACKQNSLCVDDISFSSGYRCQCLPGYQGNPYHQDGCQDIDECKVSNPCKIGICQNLLGNWTCTCPNGCNITSQNDSSKADCNEKSVRDILVCVVLGMLIVLFA